MTERFCPYCYRYFDDEILFLQHKLSAHPEKYEPEQLELHQEMLDAMKKRDLEIQTALQDAEDRK